MYGSGCVTISKEPNETEISFIGIPEGQYECVEKTYKLSDQLFDAILNDLIKVLNEKVEPEDNFGCSIEFKSGGNIVESYGDGYINYNIWQELLFSVVEKYCPGLRDYLW